MANTIQHKRSTTAGSAPVAGDLAAGELALNTADGSIYMKDSSNNIIKVGQNFASFNGDIIPDTDNTRSLGSASKMWQDVYIGPGSLYVNGQKVIEEDAGTIVLSADDDQNVQVRSGGGGDIEFYPAGTGAIEMKGSLSIQSGKNLLSNDGNPISCTVGFTMNGETVTDLATPVATSDAATKGYVDSVISSGFTLSDGSNSSTIAGGDTLTVNDGTGTTAAITGDSFAVSLATSGVTADTYGSAASVPVLTVDAYGRVTSASTVSVAGVSSFSFNSTTEVLTIGTADGSSYTADISVMASETYVDNAIDALVGGAPGTLDTLNELAAAINDDSSYAASITTALASKLDTSANAVSASVLETARTISLGGDVSGSASFDGSANVTITATVADDSHAHTIANVDGLQAELDGKLDAGATSGNGISGSASSGTFTVTSNATSDNTASTIVFRDASGNFSAGTVTATATSAQYADLAEKYTADADIEPGTVVCFGGEAEVTACNHDMDTKVAGIVSTNPAHLMNAELEGGVAVALTGRVPCKVTGPVSKGDMMVSAGNGMARAEANPAMGSVIGKALGNNEDGEGIIEVVVGRL